jgi:hypothetical protein
MYKLLPNGLFNKPSQCIARISDGACIPFAPDNTDYQEYLKWLEAGNTPLPADEQVNQ